MRREASAVKSPCYMNLRALLFETQKGEVSNIETCHLGRCGGAMSASPAAITSKDMTSMTIFRPAAFLPVLAASV